MGSALLIDAFLDRVCEPECEFVNGGSRPKPTGTGRHSRMEKRLTRLLEAFFGEDRVQFELSARFGDEILIPDVCVAQSENPRMYRDILDEAPLLCVEVLSPSQRPEEMFAKCRRYIEGGVPHCWVIDPVSQKAWEFSAPEFREAVTAFSAPCPVTLAEVFSA